MIDGVNYRRLMFHFSLLRHIKFQQNCESYVVAITLAIKLRIISASRKKPFLNILLISHLPT